MTGGPFPIRVLAPMLSPDTVGPPAAERSARRRVGCRGARGRRSGSREVAGEDGESERFARGPDIQLGEPRRGHATHRVRESGMDVWVGAMGRIEPFSRQRGRPALPEGRRETW